MKSLIQQYFTKYNLPVATLLMLSFVIFFIYLQSSQGPMVLDDVPNITQNEKLKITQLDSQSLYQAATSMHETLGGNPLLKRPLSYMSFSLNYYFFGDATQSFKITNLALHIFNGFLLYAFLLQLIRRLNRDQIVDPLMPKWIASITACCWLLHPLMVSTVFYTVQRMTILSALFSLCALNSFMFYRGKLLETGSGFFKGMTLMILFISLAFLSKENGVLVFFFCGLIEWLLFRCQFHFNFKLSYQRLYYVLLFVPIALILLFLLRQYMLSTDAVMEFRQFNTHMRLLTESRVIVDYLHIILIPQPYSAGLYSDGYPISTDLLSPISTLISIIILLMLFVLAFRLRKKQPFVTLSIGFYFIGHLIESTFIGLEIYFEHRNYLPSVFIFLLISSLLFNHYQKHKKTVILSTTLLFIVYLSFLNLRTSLWGTEEVKLSWAQKAPLSVRAHLDAASYWEEKRNAQRSLDELMKANQADPQSVLPYLSILLFECKTSSPNLLPISTNTLNSLLTNVTYHMSLFNGLQLVVHTKYATQCDFIDKDDLLNLLKATLANPSIPYNGHKANIYHLIGEVYLNEKDIDNSLLNFKKAMNTEPNMNIAFVEISQLAEADYLNEALDYIDFVKSFELFKQSKSDKLFSEYTLDSEIERLKSTIENAKTEKNSVKNGK